MEIERKYLIKNLPFNLNDYTCLEMEQAYIFTNPVIRVRRKSTVSATQETMYKYILTLKSSGILSRQEYELELDKDAYCNLIKKAEGNVISKKRYLIPLDNNLTLELDVFDGVFKGLVIGEIEFPDEETSKKYNPPEYLFREVTFDTRFHNSTLSTMSSDDILNFLVSLK